MLDMRRRGRLGDFRRMFEWRHHIIIPSKGPSSERQTHAPKLLVVADITGIIINPPNKFDRTVKVLPLGLDLMATILVSKFLRKTSLARFFNIQYGDEHTFYQYERIYSFHNWIVNLTNEYKDVCQKGNLKQENNSKIPNYLRKIFHFFKIV